VADCFPDDMPYIRGLSHAQILLGFCGTKDRIPFSLAYSGQKTREWLHFDYETYWLISVESQLCRLNTLTVSPLIMYQSLRVCTRGEGKSTSAGAPQHPSGPQRYDTLRTGTGGTLETFREGTIYAGGWRERGVT
jgi:hypothetical protein